MRSFLIALAISLGSVDLFSVQTFPLMFHIRPVVPLMVTIYLLLSYLMKMETSEAPKQLEVFYPLLRVL
jgi:hypothetical protein